MNYDTYKCLRLRSNNGVVFVTFDHPPINLLDLDFRKELDRLGRQLQGDGETTVVVFESANPDFFVAHSDLELILRYPTKQAVKERAMSWFQQILDRFRTMPKVTIAKLEGIARGGGSEFALSLDMRFAAIGKAVLGQPEVALGITPGGGATQRLPRLVGRARALEIILGCQDINAEQAALYGYVNRALPPDELGPYVDTLAYRIASHSSETVALAKAAVDFSQPVLTEGLIEEAFLFIRSLGTKPAKERLQKALDIGAQTRDGEINLQGLLDALA